MTVHDAGMGVHAGLEYAPPIKDFYANVGFEALGGSSEDLRKFQVAESQKWGKIIAKAGIDKE